MDKNELLLYLANRLKELRKAKKLSQEQVTEITGIHIGRIEQGARDVSYTTLVRLAAFFEVGLGYFDPYRK